VVNHGGRSFGCRSHFDNDLALSPLKVRFSTDGAANAKIADCGGINVSNRWKVKIRLDESARNAALVLLRPQTSTLSVRSFKPRRSVALME